MGRLVSKQKWKWEQQSKDFLKSPEWRFVRSIVLEKTNNKCCKCGSTTELHCDHIKPRIKDSACKYWLDLDNLQILCKKCNIEKGTEELDYRTEEQKQILNESKTKVIDALIERNLKVEWDIRGSDKPNKIPQNAKPEVKKLLSSISSLRTILVKHHRSLPKYIIEDYEKQINQMIQIILDKKKK